MTDRPLEADVEAKAVALRRELNPRAGSGEARGAVRPGHEVGGAKLVAPKSVGDYVDPMREVEGQGALVSLWCGGGRRDN